MTRTASILKANQSTEALHAHMVAQLVERLKLNMELHESHSRAIAETRKQSTAGAVAFAQAVEQFTASLPHVFKIGDVVHYTNDFGVYWGTRKITGLEMRTGKPTYLIEPTDTPWFSVSERNLRKEGR